MKSSRNILIAFFLNFGFAIVEFVFGTIFGSGAVLADAVHDLGDATAIGLSAILERYSNKSSDTHFTLGYKRFSLLGALLTGLILVSGSIWVVIENVPKIFHPQVINYNGMLVLGIVAIIINLLASLVVRSGESKNESILSLHFLEDILGWLVVILVSIILHFKPWYFLDPLLSVAIAIFILWHAIPKLIETIGIMLDAVPSDINYTKTKSDITALACVASVNQLNIWSLDGLQNQGIIHVCLNQDSDNVTAKEAIRNVCKTNKIDHITIEIDKNSEEHQVHC